MAQTAKVLTVNVAAVVHEGAWTGSEGKTGIDKRPVNGAIRIYGEWIGRRCNS